jgi:hypothetical protein
MELVKDTGTTKAPADWFTGDGTPETRWLESVTGEQYHGDRTNTR